MIRVVDFAILNLTPFRGPSADVGTVFELGVLMGLGKPVFGYTNSTEDLLTRVKRGDAVWFATCGYVWRDSTGMTIEDFGNADDLMIEATFIEQGCPIVRHAVRPEEWFRNLTAFEACLRLATRVPSNALRECGHRGTPG